MRTPSARRAPLAGAAAALLLLLTGCSDDPAEPSPGPGDGEDRISYVAMGDSYAAAPGVPDTSSAEGCYRSDSNYASLLAEQDPRIDLTDVTCSGATSADVVAQQVPALDEDTDLVTIGTGGNDEDLFSGVLSTCLQSDGDEARGAPCTEQLSGRVDALEREVRTEVAAALDAVVEAAPEATIVVVGYPQLAGEETCDLLPVAPGDLALVRAVADGLSDVLRTEAEERDLEFVDVAAASEGHDICSDDPWVTGAEQGDDGTFPFHPYAAEQEAIAAMLEEYV